MRPQINLPQISGHRWHIWYTSKFQTSNNFAYPKLQAPNKHIILAPLFQKSRSAPPPPESSSPSLPYNSTFVDPNNFKFGTKTHMFLHMPCQNLEQIKDTVFCKIIF